MQKYSEAKKPLNKPFRTPGGPKKFAVYVKDPESGNVKIVRFGDPNMEIKRDDPDRKKSFRARHNCDQKKDKTTAGYWSCKMWTKTPVGSITKSSNMTPFALLEKSASSGGEPTAEMTMKLTPFAYLEKIAYAQSAERGRRQQTPQPVSTPVDFRHAGRHAAQKVTEDASMGKVPLTRAATDVMRDAVSIATQDQTGGEDGLAWAKEITGPAYRQTFDHQMKTAQPDIESSAMQKSLQRYGKGVMSGLAAPAEAYAAKHGLLTKAQRP